MDNQPWLIFDLDGARFGLDAKRVRESIWLPELTPAEETPPWIVGIFSLRGRIVPVVDLHLRFRHPARCYRPADQIVVLQDVDWLTGVIVSEIREVVELPSENIQPPQQFNVTMPAQHLVTGQAQVGDSLVTLLDAARLTQRSEGTELAKAMEASTSGDFFCPDATAEERALFHTRAVALREAVPDEEGPHLDLAVVELGGEFFGLDLKAVQEFCAITQLMPIPCCPPDILGTMNLRGDLLTLIDPRSALNLPPAERGDKAVVSRRGEQAIAIAVDEVHGVIYLKGEELQAPPAERRRRGAEITGTLPYAGRMLTVLDLSALLAREEWLIDETAERRKTP